MLAQPSRARMLMALDDGRALPASVLATEAGVAAALTDRMLDLSWLQRASQGRVVIVTELGAQCLTQMLGVHVDAVLANEE